MGIRLISRRYQAKKTFAMNRILWMLCIAAAIECSKLSGAAQAAETNTFQWATRPQLSADQQKMVQLQKSIEITREDSPSHAENQQKLAALQEKLGPLGI